MKIASHQIAGVLKDTAPFIGILCYGEDAGRVRDYVTAATRGVIGAKADPFRSSVLTREEHGRIRDEVTSLSLGGGRRVIRVQDATDGLAAVLESLPRIVPTRSSLVEAGDSHPTVQAPRHGGKAPALGGPLAAMPRARCAVR